MEDWKRQSEVRHKEKGTKGVQGVFSKKKGEEMNSSQKII